MSTYLEEFAQRTLAICKEAVPKVDGVDHFFYKGTALPYFTMRLGQDDLSRDASDQERRTYILVVRYVIGHLGSKYEGENERRLYRDVPAIETAFALAGNGLQSAAYPQAQSGLHETRLTLTRGLSVFPAVNDPIQQVGTEFNLRAVFTVDISPHY